MITIQDFGAFETTWCPGCGNFGILQAMKQAFVALQLAPKDLLLCSGIGQAAKTPHYLNGNTFNGLHGRALPAAQGAKLVNQPLTVVVNSGDGCVYGEGGNHFLAAIRRNVDITVLVHDNQIYGLTKGQASPMTSEGHTTKTQPDGVLSPAFNPIAVAVGLGAAFVARSFSGMVDHLADMIALAIRTPGFALVDIMQPCVSFNKINTFSWYKERCHPLPETYDPTDWAAAMAVSREFDDRIPVGVIYRNTARTSYESKVPFVASGGPLYRRPVDMDALRQVMLAFG
ncbi:MAG: thiamine pyrophosphate-dependent enzyme [Desulfovibrionaceae bacterium]